MKMYSRNVVIIAMLIFLIGFINKPDSKILATKQDDSAEFLEKDKRADNDQEDDRKKNVQVRRSGDFMEEPVRSDYDLTEEFKVVESANSYVDQKFPNVIVVTDNEERQKGGIWTKARLDLRESFIYESYIYWGRSREKELGSYLYDKGGDGMTITLHNDPKGVDALGQDGGALGAYAHHSSQDYIHNALSFEIDAFVNHNSSFPEFDNNYPVFPGQNANDKRHMAFVLPYDPIGIDKHYGLTSFNQAEFEIDKWQKFEYIWEPNKDGSARAIVKIEGRKVSEFSIANFQDVFKSSYAYLGFTGATGALTALQAVATTKLPILIGDVYDVKFDLNNGEGIPPNPQSVRSGELLTPISNVPTRPGYKFANWNTQADGKGKIWDFGKDTVTGNITLYAQWEINKFQVKFDVNKGESAAPATQNIEPGQKVTAPAAPTRAGHKFANWNTQADGKGKRWDFEKDTVTGNITLYAQWEINKFQVKFDVNKGESAAPATQNIDWGQKVRAPAAPTRAGHKFANWNTQADGKGKIWDFEKDTVTGNITLYAQWDINKFQVKFDVNKGESAAPATQNIDWGQKVNAPAAPTRAGHKFTNWNTQADGKGKRWDFEKDTVTGNTTLYAQWLNLKPEIPAIDPNTPPPNIGEEVQNPYLGTVSIRFVSDLDFGKVNVSNNDQEIYNNNQINMVTVQDLRNDGERGEWRLTVKLEKENDFFDNKLHFSPYVHVDNYNNHGVVAGKDFRINNKAQVFASVDAKNAKSKEKGVFSIGMTDPESEGVKLSVPGGTSVGNHKSHLTWNLVIGP